MSELRWSVSAADAEIGFSVPEQTELPEYRRRDNASFALLRPTSVRFSARLCSIPLGAAA